MQPLDPKLLEILACPATLRPLHVADETELTMVRKLIDQGVVRLANGGPASVNFEGLLITDDGALGYRIQGGIPILLVEEGLKLGQ